jgi:fatty-acid desaturase
MLFVTHYLTATIGSSVCFHRMLSHRSFRSPKWLEHVFATFGVCSLQDSPIRWVAIHRRHHQYTDEREDPHSPLVSFLWGHVGWVVLKNNAISSASFYDKYARDLLRDPYYFFLERNRRWFWVYMAHALLIGLIGFGVGCVWTFDGMSTWASGLRMSASVLVWAVALRTIVGWHSTWAVNSLCHMWGYRNYSTTDHSTNSFMMGILASGEGWHNNHHADPHCAKIGHRWWEIDLGWWTIALLSKVGLATEVVAEPRTGRILTADEEKVPAAE